MMRKFRKSDFEIAAAVVFSAFGVFALIADMNGKKSHDAVATGCSAFMAASSDAAEDGGNYAKCIRDRSIYNKQAAARLNR